MAEGLRRLGRRSGATLFVTLVAALKALLRHHCGRDDVAVGVDVAHRGRPELDGVVGFFADQLVLRDRLSAPQRFAELVAAVRETWLEADEHRDLPYDLLVAELAPRRDRRSTPLFQVKVAYQEHAAGGLELPGVEVEELELASGLTRFDLTLFAHAFPDRLELALEYDADLFDGATAARLEGGLRAVLAAVAADPEVTLGDLDRRLALAAGPREEERKPSFEDLRSRALAGLAGRRGGAESGLPGS